MSTIQYFRHIVFRDKDLTRWETTAVSSVVAARQQLQSIKSEIMQSKIYCVFKDTPNEFFYRNENARDIKYRIVKYFTKQPL